ncbi:MAG: hypothetical protein WAR83_10215 [Flavobacteriales bacterium]
MSTSKEQIPVWQIAVLYLVLAFALYWRVLGLSFFADDFSAVWRIGVHSDLSTTSFFRPLAELSIWKNHLLFGTDPTGYRVTNVILHWFNAILISLLVRCTIDAKSDEMRWAPVVAGLLFLCYPFHNEGVVWIVGRGASLATLFILLGLIVSLSSMADRSRVIWSSVSFFLGMLAYETAMVFPLIALPVLWLNGVRAKRLAPFAGTWTGVLVLHFLIRAWATEQIANSYGVDFFSQPFTNYFSNIPKVLGRLFVPPNASSNAVVVATIIVVLVLVLFAWFYVRCTRDIRSERINALAWSWMLIIACSVPLITSVSTRTTESDRFLYMPSAFLCGLIPIMLFRIAHGPIRWMVVAILLIASQRFLQQNNDNWIAASNTIGSIIHETPEPLPDAHLFIQSLPSDTCGAFIFRHGFTEALLMAGRDTSRMVVRETEPRIDLFEVEESTQVVRWTGTTFDYVK